jgi:hypothetical protein
VHYKWIFCCCLYCLLLPWAGNAQEHTAPLNYNPFVQAAAPKTRPHLLMRPTTLSLPFFDDFTIDDLFPNPNLWIAGQQVYINNTMGRNPISRGVATLDGLSQYGVPYDTLNPYTLRYADSLTSMPIDLSSYSPADSIYLSFFYQPQGNGFAPKTTDSLMLFMLRENGVWVKAWSMQGTAVAPFTQVMIPVALTDYLHSGFQFRFVNKVSIGLADNVWHVDYIRMNAHRSIHDTAVNDIAFSEEAGSMLQDYTFMPYRQFMANPSGARAAQQTVHIRNHYGSGQSVVVTRVGKETQSSLPLDNTSSTPWAVGSYADAVIPMDVYSNTAPQGGLYDKVVFQNQIFLNPAPAGQPQDNDTIIQRQVFDNYLAYDDGTAEQSYFLNLFPSLPGKVAIDFNLNQPDTMRGVAIYFGRQVPMASNKFFAVQVYKNIAFNGGTDQLIYQEENLLPGYVDTVNHFWVYKLETPVVLPAGVFYVGIMQPAFSGSLYYGLDVNRTGGNHLYYNVLGTWQSSLVSGALMIRPLLGQPVQATGATSVASARHSSFIYPVPADRFFYFRTGNSGTFAYRITDLHGRIVQTGKTQDDTAIDVSALSGGVYFVSYQLGTADAQPFKLLIR